jgi:ABC-type nickel/cobalt efflux system permease component RcnA
MHTASVLAVGLLVLSAEQLFPPERVYPYLGLLSGLVVLGLGSFLLRSRLRARRAARDEHQRDHGGDHDHRHPVLDPASSLLSRKSLVALAISGGALPSPTALVVLLAAVALHRLAFGLALIVAFSLGLAGALTAVGLVAIRARDALARRMNAGFGQLIPVGSAAVIMGVGTYLLARAAIQL